ncbi:ADP-ribosylglycohydrolase family protein [Bacillus massilinigeriensis]|uniref:ADP-ribosylglycohydrolase family protein n=1 Tax=Bacillus mediterraneensis TaxID=1805474 RepID=UPI0008F939FC|nr:ADP-ribosylglycohydrolase family protein [Bacillus mediterraneensis]
MRDKILGTLYGMAIGDAMGMPSELWGRRRIKQYFGKIETFLDGPEDNIIAKNYKKGQFTDDTSQALIILDALMETGFVPDSAVIARRLLEWAERMDAFDKEILGPSSKAALGAIKQGKDPSPFTKKAETNGSAMRIAPIGCLFSSDRKAELVEYVYNISKVTHQTEAAITGAAMVAGAVSSAIEDKGWDEIMADAMEISDIAFGCGEETFSASIPERLKLGLQFARDLEGDEIAFIEKVYNVIGSGVLACESVPAALSIAYFAKEPERCSLLCANMGGDTDTIGAMATAICGAKAGIGTLRLEWIRTIDESNEIDFEPYVNAIMNARKGL